MKKIIFNILIASLALFVSAYINVEKIKRFAVVYYHVGNLYTTTIPIGTCLFLSTGPCIITYATSQGTSFPDTSLPIGGTPSSQLGRYQ